MILSPVAVFVWKLLYRNKEEQSLFAVTWKCMKIDEGFQVARIHLKTQVMIYNITNISKLKVDETNSSVYIIPTTWHEWIKTLPQYLESEFWYNFNIWKQDNQIEYTLIESKSEGCPNQFLVRFHFAIDWSK